jgi:hypothetical protein
MKPTSRSGRYLPPWLLQTVGALTFVGASVFWAVTGHQSVLIMGAAMALIGLGAYSGLHVSINREFENQVEKADELDQIDQGELP